MKKLARLGFAAVAMAYVEIMLGSWTRINHAGLTCPDYPLCRGAIIPPLAGGTVWEWLHRLTALLLSLLVLALLVQGMRLRKRVPMLGPACTAVAALFLLQVFLGAATVRMENAPLSVVWHWGTGMALVASLAAVAIIAHVTELSAVRSRRSVLTIGVLTCTGLIAFITMCIGAYVSSSGAGLACISIPGCAGNAIVYGSGQYVQMVHRIAAAASLLSSVGAFVVTWLWPNGRSVRVSTAAGLLLIFLQIVLGLLNVALRLPVQLREAHAANAALVFLAFVCAAFFAALDSEPERRTVSA